MNEEEKHEVGKSYLSLYWMQRYTVLALNGDDIKIRWSDGRVVTHGTARNGDPEINGIDDVRPDVTIFKVTVWTKRRNVRIARR